MLAKLLFLCDIFATKEGIESAIRWMLLLGHSSLDLAPPIAGSIFGQSVPTRVTARGAHAALIRKLGATPIDYQRGSL